jgi:hypothetical protein
VSRECLTWWDNQLINGMPTCKLLYDTQLINQGMNMKVRFLLSICLLANAVHAQAGGRVTVGTFAMRPSSCTAGDLYVTSDTNLIYQCGPANAWANVVSKYGTADAYRYVSSLGSDSNDGLSPGTAFATPQKCNTVVVALGGGTCDARTLYSYTTSTEIDVGQHTSPVPVTLLVPPYGSWTGSMTGGTLNVLKVFNFGSVIGASAGAGIQFVIHALNGSSVVDVCGTDPSPVGGGAYVHISGINCAADSGSAVSGAALEIQALFDASDISDDSSSSNVANTKVLYVHGLCCGTKVTRVAGDAHTLAGTIPCTFTGNISIEFDGISCTHGGTGASQVVINLTGTNNGPSKFSDFYMEEPAGGTDRTTAAVAITGSSGYAAQLENFNLGAEVASSTRFIVDIANGASAVLNDITGSSISMNIINDHNTGGKVITGPAGTLVKTYTTNPYVTQKSYLAAPSVTGLTNDTGLQIFNTTTTCTTAATINTPCTTAAITLPVGYADTNYRLQCQGLGPTNFPQLQTVTKSNTSFTITLNNLTAAAASYSSFDCSAEHN